MAATLVPDPQPIDGHALREWLGIAIGFLILGLIFVGVRELGYLRGDILSAEARVGRIEEKLRVHSESANDANLALAKILGAIDGRLKWLEGIEKERSRGRSE